MKREVSRFLLVTLLLFGLWTDLFAQHQDDNDDGISHTSNPYDEGPTYGPQCGVYYAESTIPGAGFGLFAGRDFDESEWVLPGDLVVPLVEMGWHNGHQSYHHLWEEYQWSGSR